MANRRISAPQQKSGNTLNARETHGLAAAILRPEPDVGFRLMTAPTIVIVWFCCATSFIAFCIGLFKSCTNGFNGGLDHRQKRAREKEKHYSTPQKTTRKTKLRDNQIIFNEAQIQNIYHCVVSGCDDDMVTNTTSLLEKLVRYQR